MVTGGKDQSSSGECRLESALPGDEAAVSGASSKKWETPQNLERLKNAPSLEEKKFVRPLDHAQEIWFSFT